MGWCDRSQRPCFLSNSSTFCTIFLSNSTLRLHPVDLVPSLICSVIHMQFQEFHHFVSHILKSNFKIKCQDIVVLGKNGRHSFERMRDRIPASTRSNYRTNWKRITGTPARERPLTRVRARSEKIGPTN